MWRKLPTGIALPEAHFLATNAQISASHDACHRSGVKTGQVRIVDILPDDEIETLLSRHCSFVTAARSLFIEMYQYLVHELAIILMTERDGRIISLHSAPELACHAADIGLRIGASLAETSCGTNAVAFALRHKCPTVVRAQQHYCEVFHDWCCVAAPIVSLEGEVVGCVGLCNEVRHPLGEKLALAVLLAKMLSSVCSRSDSATRNTESRIPHAPNFSTLSSRQSAILSLLGTGKTYKQIGAELGISTRTVESHVEKLRRKYGARTTAQLVVLVTTNDKRSSTLSPSALAMSSTQSSEDIDGLSAPRPPSPKRTKT